MATQPTLDTDPSCGPASAPAPDEAPTHPSAAIQATVEQLVAAIRAGRYRYANEAQLHLGISDALTAAGLTAEHEVTLAASERIDFLTHNGVGIEVKVDGRSQDVWGQLARYAARPQVRALLLVTTRVRHATGAPTAIGDTPLTVLVLRGGL